MISRAHESELCRSLRYLAEFTELTEADVNNLHDEARSFVLAAIPNEDACCGQQGACRFATRRH